MVDNRAGLEKNSEIIIQDKIYKIENEIGRGANCIVYNAKYRDNLDIEHNIRLKECFPVYLSLERTRDNEVVVCDDNTLRFENVKKEFIETYRRNVELRKTLGLINSTINSTDILEYNNTVYSVMSLDEGIDYGKYEDKSLIELLEHIKSIAIIIEKYHGNGYLHLDLKPENVFIMPETTEHIMLFDFDSVITFAGIEANDKVNISYTEGFSAPEQIQGRINRIGKHTDIFSIGAILFYKLFDRKPDLDDMRISSRYNFEDMRFKDSRYQPALYKTMEKFLRKTLSVSTASRWSEMKQVIEALDEMINLSDVTRLYLVDSFQYNQACFVGRNKEIECIKEMFNDSNAIFLSGIGGIGKTEFAKQYVKRNRKNYNNVVFAIFNSSIEQMVCESVNINGISRDKDESTVEYFNRKMQLLETILTADDLIIMDNFDVDSEINLERFLQLPCKFIITTREDFRDYNYKQLVVDKIEDEEDIMELFLSYNDIEYSKSEKEAISELLQFVDYHTMTVELIAKYLQHSDISPEELIDKFLEQEGINNTNDTKIKHRKDRKLSAESVNRHLRMLFDLSGFDEIEKEILCDLSIFAGVNIRRGKFEELCDIKNAHIKVEKLIKHGWIMEDEITGKIYLHQIIQDLVYKDLAPDTSKCEGIIRGMSKYMEEEPKNFTEKHNKELLLDIFLERMSGNTIEYAKLCMLSKKVENLEKAEEILLEYNDREKYNLLQKTYKKLIDAFTESDYILEIESDDALDIVFAKIYNWLEKAIDCCEEYSEDPDYLSQELIEAGQITDRAIDGNIIISFSKKYSVLDSIYELISKIYEIATDNIPKSSYNNEIKERMYSEIKSLYYRNNILGSYKDEYVADSEKAFFYQKKMMELRPDKPDIIKHYGNTVTEADVAEDYRKRGEYDKAIAMYKSGYKEGNLAYKTVMEELADIYCEINDIDKAIECLENILAAEKNYENTQEGIYWYSEWVCCKLIRLLVKQKRYDTATKYCYELLHYCDEKCAVYILVAYFYLYKMSEDRDKQDELWNICLEYYRKTGDNGIPEKLYEFIKEYLKKEMPDGREIIQIVDKIFGENYEKFRVEILENSIEKYKSCKNGYEPDYYIVLFYARLAKIKYPSSKHKDMMEKCRKALDIYNEFVRKYSLEKYIGKYLEMDKEEKHIENNEGKQVKKYVDKNTENHMEKDAEFLRSYIYDIIAKNIEYGKYDYDEIKKYKRKCNYELLAENKIHMSVLADDEIIDIWEGAAYSYDMVENYRKASECLIRALPNMLRIYENDKNKEFESTYYNLMKVIINTYIDDEDNQNASLYIEKLYAEFMDYINNNKKCDELVRSDMVRIMSDIAYLFLSLDYIELDVKPDMDYIKMVLDKYLCTLYLLAVENIDVDLIKNINNSETQIEKMYQSIMESSCKDSISEKIDWILSVADDISETVYTETKQEDKYKIYKKIADYFIDKYKKNDMEFR